MQCISSIICLCLIIFCIKKYGVNLRNVLIFDFLISLILFGKIHLNIQFFGQNYEFETGFGIKIENVLNHVDDN